MRHTPDLRHWQAGACSQTLSFSLTIMRTMPLPFRRTRHALTPLAAVFGGALLLSACASNPDSAYAPRTENSATDARNQYQDFRGREAVRAPSQLQISLDRSNIRKNTQANASASAAEAEAQAQSGDTPPDIVAAPGDGPPVLPEPAYEGSPWLRDTQTYLGTVPCFTGDASCRAQKVTLTLSPNGRWRSRTITIDPPSNPPETYTDQGCWRASGENRERVTLYNTERTQSIASFSFSHGNALILRQLHDQGSRLTYRLSRQPEIDPISELGQTAPDCHVVP
ncbi:NlpE-like protein [Kerstersia similis]